MSWSAAEIPDQSGRVAIVTGANSGLGLETTRELVAAGASVIMACRNLDKGRTAAGHFPVLRPVISPVISPMILPWPSWISPRSSRCGSSRLGSAGSTDNSIC